jgi:hypothetical protein
MATRKISRASRRSSPASSHRRSASRQARFHDDSYAFAILGLVRARAAAAVVAAGCDVNARIVMVESVLQPLTEDLAQLDPDEAAGYESGLMHTTYPQESLAHGIEMLRVTTAARRGDA